MLLSGEVSTSIATRAEGSCISLSGESMLERVVLWRWEQEYVALYRGEQEPGVLYCDYNYMQYTVLNDTLVLKLVCFPFDVLFYSSRSINSI